MNFNFATISNSEQFEYYWTESCFLRMGGRRLPIWSFDNHPLFNSSLICYSWTLCRPLYYYYLRTWIRHANEYNCSSCGHWLDDIFVFFQLRILSSDYEKRSYEFDHFGHRIITPYQCSKCSYHYFVDYSNY